MFGITTIPGLVALFTIVGAILSFYIYDYLGIKSKRVKVAEAKDSFDKIVGNLSSADNTTKLAAAIMLRRFLDGQNKRKRTFLFQESVNVISSMLKVLRGATAKHCQLAFFRKHWRMDWLMLAI